MPDELTTRLGRLAALQAGIITRQQALRLGFSSDAIRQRLERGRWQRIHRGVYACFSGPAGDRALIWAAVLFAGPGGALSHQTAAYLDGLAGCERGPIHVSVPAARHVSAARGLVIHRASRVVAATHPARRPPRTRIEETVLDLTQASPTFDEAFGWLSLACAERLTTPARIEQAMAARGKVRWRADLSGALTLVADGAHSPLEYRYIRDVERPHGLPRAQRQARTQRDGHNEYRDNFYPDYGLAVETDGAAAHPDSARWRDIARDNAAAAAGIVTLRYSWADVTTRPCEVAAEVGAVLRIRGWTGWPVSCRPACPVQPAPRTAGA